VENRFNRWCRTPGKYWLLGAAAIGATGLATLAVFGPARVTITSADTLISSAPTSVPAAFFLTLAEKLAQDQPVSIYVLGDSTGRGDEQWVSTLARDLSAKYNRTTDIAGWNLDTLGYDLAARVGEGSGAPLTIWNGSAIGQTPSESQNWLATMIPVSRADLIIVNHGHNTGPGFVLDITRLSTEIRHTYRSTPLAVTIQNPSLAEAPATYTATAEKIRRWTASGLNWTVIDVFTAYMEQPDLTSLYEDTRRPNDAGARVWADTAKSALGI
jgi:hypothetical protein